MGQLSKPRSQTVPELLTEIAAVKPRHEALVTVDKRWTYEQLVNDVQRVAKSLLHSGVQQGDRVGILAGNRAEWLLSHFAISTIGAISVGLNTWATAQELAYQLHQAGIKLLLVEPQFRDRNFIELVSTAQAHQKDLSGVRMVKFDADKRDGGNEWEQFLFDGERIESQSVAERAAAVSADDIACMLFTSGSTALPKGVPLSHRGLIDNMWEIGERMHLTPNDRLWLAVSLFWSFASVNALFALLTHRATIVLQHHFDAPRALDLIHEERCSVFYGTPNIVQALVDAQAQNPRDISTLRTGLTLGTPAQVERAESLGIPEICNVYGLTEAYGNTTVADAYLPLAQRLETVGQVLPGQEIKIVDAESRIALAPMETGEILIRGNVTPGYWQAPEQNAEAFTPDGWFCSGDLGYLDHEGFLYFRGRLKEMIKSGGINVSPAEVEQVLVQHPAVELAFVTGIPDAILDEKVVAVIVCKQGHEIDGDSLAGLCRQSLASYKTPRDFRFVTAAELPLTTTGKLQRKRLAELFE